MAFNMMPPGVPRVGRPRLPFRMPPGVTPPGVQVGAGALAVLCAALGAIPFVDDFGVIDTETRIAVILSIAAAVIGGVLTIVRIAVGPPLAAGGAAWFVSAAASLGVSRIDAASVLDSTQAKLTVAAGVVGVVAVVLAATLLLGRALSALGGVTAALAVVVVVCQALTVHIDDSQEVVQFATIASSVVLAAVVVLGGVKGRWGAVAALVAATARVPDALRLAVDADDRKAAAVAALIALFGIVGLAAIAVVLASSGGVDGAFGRGPEHAVVSPVVLPMVRPTAVPGVARQGRVLEPVSVVLASNDRQDLGATSAVATMTHAQIAGQWSADPYGRFQTRYYDGTRWTEHVSTDGVPAIDPVPR